VDQRHYAERLLLISLATALNDATENNHAEVVRVLLLDSRVNPTKNNHEAVIIAAQKGRTGCMELFLKDIRVKPAFNNNILLTTAAANGHSIIIYRSC
jgi:hypothetical protein